jgi:hypothetical protein
MTTSYLPTYLPTYMTLHTTLLCTLQSIATVGLLGLESRFRGRVTPLCSQSHDGFSKSGIDVLLSFLHRSVNVLHLHPASPYLLIRSEHLCISFPLSCPFTTPRPTLLFSFLSLGTYAVTSSHDFFPPSCSSFSKTIPRAMIPNGEEREPSRGGRGCMA